MSRRNPLLIAFGLNVRRRREELDFTQEKLAEKAALDQTYISGVERGVRNPSVMSIVRLAKGLNTTASELCLGIER